MTSLCEVDYALKRYLTGGPGWQRPAFKAAVETGYPVVPIGLVGTREVLPAETWLPKPGTITVTVGGPLHPIGRGWQDMVRLRDATRAQIASLAGEQPKSSG